MTDDRSFERAARSWLETGPTQAPERALQAAFLEIDFTPQERDWHVLWRLPKMTTPFRAAAAAVIGVLAVAGGFYFLNPGSQSGVGGPGPTPTASISTEPSAAPSSSPSSSLSAFACDNDLPGCLGPLQAGEHRSVNFKPKVKYTTPAGWTNSLDTDSILQLNPPNGADPYILLWTDVQIAESTGSCPPAAKAGVGSKVQDWIDFLTTHPGLVTTDPVPVDFVGGADSNGQAIDVSVSADWTAGCPGPKPEIMLIAHLGDPPAMYGVDVNAWLHLIFLEVGTNTVVIEVYGPPSAAGLAAAVAKAKPIIDSFVFGCGPSVPRPCLTP